MNIVFAEPIGLTAAQKKYFFEQMSAQDHSITYYDSIPANQNDLLNRAKDTNILVISNYIVSEEVVKKLPNLKMIAVAFTGVDHIPLSLCKEKGIAVCNAAGYSTQAVAELTIGVAIDLYRKITPFDGITRQNGARSGFLGNEISGKTFGIIGFGEIGVRVAKLAQAFGCKVIAWSRTAKKVQGVDFVPFDQLLQEADIVSLHIPLTDQTKGLINESKLRLMKSNAVLINTARGPIIDYSALSIALKDGVIAGVAIDVYEHEPPIESNHPILNAPNTILLPHIGFATKEAISSRSEIVLNNIKNWINGSPTNTV